MYYVLSSYTAVDDVPTSADSFSCYLKPVSQLSWATSSETKTQKAGNDETLPTNALDAIGRCDPVVFPNVFMLPTKNFVRSYRFLKRQKDIFLADKKSTTIRNRR